MMTKNNNNNNNGGSSSSGNNGNGSGDSSGGSGDGTLTVLLPSLVGDMIQDQDPNIQHDTIPTPDHKAPLAMPELLALFSNSITTLRSDEALYVPSLVKPSHGTW